MEILLLFVRFLRTSPRWQLVTGGVVVGILGFVGAALMYARSHTINADVAAGAFGGVAIAVAIFGTVQQAREITRHTDLIKQAETQTQQHPDKPRYAWEAGRLRLESYLDKNLGQLRSIYYLVIGSMTVGFIVIVGGLMKAMDDPSRLPVAVVSAASGVVISFLGGSLLLVYKSIMKQSTEFVSVLERINAVGMAVNVIESIPDDAKDLRNETSAALARELLVLYGGPAGVKRKKHRKSKPS